MRGPVVPVLVAAIGIPPNALAALYNFQHNSSLIIEKTAAGRAARLRGRLARRQRSVVPAGRLVIVYLGRRLITVPRGLRRGRTYDAVTLARTRHDALLFSDRVAAVVMSLWIASGIAFPVALSVITGEIDTRAATHFVTSMAVCGAIAVAYPFFLRRLLHGAVAVSGGPAARVHRRHRRP